MLHRRTLLSGSAALLLAGCSRSTTGPTGSSTPPTNGAGATETIAYGEDPAQFLELTRPQGTSRGVVVVIHGGFWLAQFDLSLGRPLAASLVDDGWTAANLEYRRVGNGGGWPATFDDVSAGIDALADVEDLDTSRVITLGHSAGGHLGVWAAARQRSERWTDATVPVTGAVSQAGVLDLRSAVDQSLGGGAVQGLMGDDLEAQFATVDPLSQVPLDVPVRCIHGSSDGNVPLSQSTAYVDAATDAGADATLTEVDGDHFTLIDPGSGAWRQTRELLDELV
ncbi:S9 family peptidase [Nocardioides panacisoli]|uniref:alpha/beta hydrolase family protein n=1 Tax=Nocardioides panacisoli TaxID=627624 RepID=UPI001C635276|nr:prolyl oligopeptidase family serine peptidase [Nocardioides panacisoli]QYJ03345.1 S9 family peptidase [Nocardioides panacisoli]